MSGTITQSWCIFWKMHLTPFPKIVWIFSFPWNIKKYVRKYKEGSVAISTRLSQCYVYQRSVLSFKDNFKVIQVRRMLIIHVLTQRENKQLELVCYTPWNLVKEEKSAIFTTTLYFIHLQAGELLKMVVLSFFLDW